MATLSKSRFLSGLQCEKKLYFDLFRKELKPPVSAEQQAIFDNGHRVGALAREAFPGGQDATEGMEGNWSIAIARTKEWLQNGVETLYEAAFSVPGGFAALDILHHHNGERHAIEVKSSSSVKDYHITDASYQYFVMKRAGFAPDRFFLMHIDNQYVRQGPVVLEQLFRLEDITQSVLDSQTQVALRSAELLRMLKAAKEPVKEIGKHCNEPFRCDYAHHCWAHLSFDSVFELKAARNKDWDLYGQGVLSLADIPDDYKLTHLQTLQVRGVKYGETYVDMEKLRGFLEGLKGPLYFFDFETINPVIPVLDGTSPFDQVPFQYSLHQTDLDGQILHGRSFLADPSEFTVPAVSDPLLLLINQLKKDIGAEGTILAYNAGFEIRVLKWLAGLYERERDFIESLIERMVDLLLPFRSGWYYVPEMGSSASIKSVLPAIDPEFSYKDLPINNGGDASNIFHCMTRGGYTDNLAEIRNNLLKYCERDTEGMVVIYRHLRKLITA